MASWHHGIVAKKKKAFGTRPADLRHWASGASRPLASGFAQSAESPHIIEDMPRLDPRSTTWHITFGTYGSRLHGSDRATVDRRQGRPGEAFVHRDPDREAAQRGQMSQPAVSLTLDQQQLIQQIVPELCQRGGWAYRVCSAGADHVHVLLDIEPTIGGERVRRILKRWLTQALDRRWGKPRSGRWWARQGSNRPIDNERYLSNATDYIARQRA